MEADIESHTISLFCLVELIKLLGILSDGFGHLPDYLDSRRTEEYRWFSSHHNTNDNTPNDEERSDKMTEKVSTLSLVIQSRSDHTCIAEYLFYLHDMCCLSGRSKLIRTFHQSGTTIQERQPLNLTARQGLRAFGL